MRSLSPDWRRQWLVGMIGIVVAACAGVTPQIVVPGASTSPGPSTSLSPSLSLPPASFPTLAPGATPTAFASLTATIQPTVKPTHKPKPSKTPAPPTVPPTEVVTPPPPPPTTSWPPPGDILASDAPNHVGEHQTVCGTVVAANWVFTDPGHPTWLNFDAAYPNMTFNGLIWGEQRRAWPVGNPEGSGKPEVIYLNKQVCVTGTIEQYKTWYQIQDLTIGDIAVVP